MTPVTLDPPGAGGGVLDGSCAAMGDYYGSLFGVGFGAKGLVGFFNVDGFIAKLGFYPNLDFFSLISGVL